MMKPTLLLATTVLLRLCGRDNSQPQTAAAPPGALIAEHGGAMGFGAGLSAEVVAAPDGRLVTYVRDAQRTSVASPTAQIAVSMRKPDGTIAPVAMAFDSNLGAYVGRPSGIAPGAYTVDVSLQTTAAAPPVQIATPPVMVTAVAPMPPARHGGQVQVVGDHAVEIVPLHSGEVAMFWTDLYGYPIQPAEVSVPSVRVTVNGRVENAMPRLEGDHFVARASVLVPQQPVGIELPVVTVRGVTFGRIAFAAPPPLPVLPRVTVALPPRPALPVNTAPFVPLPSTTVGAFAPMPSMPGGNVNVRVNVNMGGQPPMPSPVVMAPSMPSPMPMPMPVAGPAPTVVVRGPMPPPVYVAPPQPAVAVRMPQPVYVAAQPAQPAAVVVAPQPAPVGRDEGRGREHEDNGVRDHGRGEGRGGEEHEDNGVRDHGRGEGRGGEEHGGGGGEDRGGGGGGGHGHGH